MLKKVHVKKNDQVVVISGPATGDHAVKGKQGKVLNVFPKTGKVIVEGVAFVTKHQKARRQGQQGGIFQKEARYRRLQRDARSAPSAARRPAWLTARKRSPARMAPRRSRPSAFAKRCKADID